MPKLTPIRWTTGRRLELNDVTRSFNSKINRLANANPELAPFLPSQVSANDLMGSITTSKEYNNIIKSMLRFTKAGAETLVTSDRGATTTKWQLDETKRELSSVNAKRRYLRDRLNNSDAPNKQRIIDEFNLKKKNLDFLTKNQRQWEIFQQTVHRQAGPSYYSDRVAQYKKNYLKATDRLNIYKPLIENLAQRMDGWQLYDLYYDEEAIQISYNYGQNPILDKVGKMLDAFAKYGYVYTKEELMEMKTKGDKFFAPFLHSNYYSKILGVEPLSETENTEVYF